MKNKKQNKIQGKINRLNNLRAATQQRIKKYGLLTGKVKCSKCGVEIITNPGTGRLVHVQPFLMFHKPVIKRTC